MILIPSSIFIMKYTLCNKKCAMGTETCTLHDIAALPDVLVSHRALWDKNCKKEYFVSFWKTVHSAGGPISEQSYNKERKLPHVAEYAGKCLFFLVLTYVSECWPLATKDENILLKYEIRIPRKLYEPGKLNSRPIVRTRFNHELYKTNNKPEIVQF
jgi:hypothetical protein